ncbi:XdhC family protein [Actinoplanes bogorensis]|uniref:XdhC family protein n=1 Tax=Paractinoplanes bogorensis TaxID=1610840 RepID=A0ABS5YXZ4_9ACTN|nr:XdhC family protein [Actinoplanes bogorensis]MBU2668319.1 XdhC family protein [Actinoplanes bogorensis]
MSRLEELTRARRPFVHATVVRAQEPTSARAGDDAVILDDGSIEGFVGGVCAESSVRAAALDALSSGATLLLRVLPDDGVAFPETPGALNVVNPCHSGGALEIFLRPVLPKPLLGVVGETPIARAVASLAEFLDFEINSVPSYAGTAAVVVAGLGRNEETALRAALDASVPYIALVASHKRGAAVLDGMGLTDGERSRIRAHAGLDIRARTHKEIALSILAEIVRERRAAETGPAPCPREETDADSAAVAALSEVAGVSRGADLSTKTSRPQAPDTILSTSPTMTSGGTPWEGGVGSEVDHATRLDHETPTDHAGSPRPAETVTISSSPPRRAIDPVCGMTVFIDDDTPHAVVDGQEHWFCRTACRDTYVTAAA